jgi:YidC/Oxa1 family membrane protein insertase
VPQPPCPLQTPLPTIAPGEPNAGQPLPHALCPAQPSGNPVDLLAWLFNPIFQSLFLGLAGFYHFTGDVGIAIIVLTLLIKTVLLPLNRAQIVSQRRMQLLQPEIRALQQKFKGNRSKISEETMRLYRERGINPASGCLPAILQLGLLIPIYSVISTGLAAPDISSALQFLGIPVLQDLQCQTTATLQPCIDPIVPWLAGMDAHLPQVSFRLPVLDFPVSVLALIAAGLQLVQTRMMTPSTNDPQTAAQQRIFMILPLFSIIYGAILPAGLFLYWIVFTFYSIVQQYLIVGWGSLFPLFGWTPGFAKGHEPRFPVSIAPVVRSDTGTSGTSRTTTTTEPSRSPTDSAAGTIRPARTRARTSRRGRRR